jgi:ABC-2 type transport system permease protein
MTTRTLFLVARRELDARLRTRSFVVGTVLALAVLAGFVLTQSTLFDRDHSNTIGLNGQAIAVADQLTDEASKVGRDVRTVEVTNLAAGRARVADGELDALVSGAPAALTVLVDKGLDDELRGVLTGLVRQQVLRGQLAALSEGDGLDVDGLLRTVADAHVEVRVLAPADPQAGERLAVALTVVALVFLALLLFGSLVAQSVVEEKTGHLLDFLLPAVRPGQLLGGKVLALGALGFAQLLLVGMVGLVIAAATGVLSAPGIGVVALVWALAWFVLGFLLYAMVFAAAGARVSRQDEAHSLLMPVTAVLLVGFVLAFAVLSRHPAGVTSTVLSLLPPLSPIFMPGRIALAAVPAWQVVVSLVLTGLAAVGATRVGLRGYR